MLIPLTRDFYADPGRTTSTQDGSIGQPFKTAVAAIAAVAALPPGVKGAVLLADGDYTAEDPVITSRMSLRGIGEGRGSVQFNSLTIGNGASLVQVSNIVSITTSVENARLVAHDCETLGAVTLLSSGGGSGALELFNSDAQSVTFTQNNQGLLVENSTISGVLGGIDGGSVQLTHAQVNGQVDCTTLNALDSSMGVVTAQNDATLEACNAAQLLVTGTLRVDAYTLSAARLAAIGPNTFGALVVTDRPLTTGVTFTVPVLAAGMADVTAAIVGARPGDTFELTSSTRLAGVGIVDSWCAADDVLTVRFFGTTVGGDVVLSVNLNPNS